MKITMAQLRRLIAEAYRVPDQNPGPSALERHPELFIVDEPHQIDSKAHAEESETDIQHRERQEALKRRARQRMKKIMGDYGDITGR